MDMVEVSIERRQGQGKGTARKLRRAGGIPAVFYGPKRATVSIAVRAEEFERKLSHLEGSHLIRLVNDGGKDADLHDKAVLLREIQRHPVTDEVLHADFFEVDLTERLAVSVPLRFVGKAVGVVEGAPAEGAAAPAAEAAPAEGKGGEAKGSEGKGKKGGGES